jgi:hypothetical protein
MKAKITLKLDADLLREVRIMAAEERTSIILVSAHDRSAEGKYQSAQRLVEDLWISGRGGKRPISVNPSPLCQCRRVA